MGIIKTYEDTVFMGLVDALGHGKIAHEVATACERYMDENYQKDLKSIMKGLHEEIGGTRGAVVGLCLIDINSREVQYVGVGNISARVFGPNHIRLTSLPGIVGQTMPRLRMFRTGFCPANVIVLYTDGIKENFELKEYPDMLHHDAKTITRNIIRLFGKKSDDAACMAVRLI